MAPSKESIQSTVTRLDPPSPKWIDGRALAANVAESYTVPAGINVIDISSSLGVYVNFSGGTAAAITDLNDGTASLIIPASKTARFRVAPGDVISVMWTAIGTVSFAGWKE